MHDVPQDPAAALLAAHLRANAGRYVPGGDGATARATLVRVDRRSVSRLYEFDVSVGDRHEAMLVKVPVVAAEAPRTAAGVPGGRDRPRRASLPDPGAKAELEHAALRAIHDHFTRLGDPRLGAVRVFDYLPQERAVVMQFLGEPNLRQLVMRSWRTRRRGMVQRLRTVFGNAGAWLRNYHALPLQPHVRRRHSRRPEFAGYVTQVATFLGESLREREYCAAVARHVEELADRVLPPALPLGRAHGDFAMRNVLVAPGGRVTVLDTLGRFSSAIYEDVGYFLADLKCNPVHGLGWLSYLGRRRIAAFEQAFLAGYFEGTPVPTRAIALYEVQAILDRWASYALRRERAAGAGLRFVRSTQSLVMSRLFRRLLEERLRVAAGDADVPAPPRS